MKKRIIVTAVTAAITACRYIHRLSRPVCRRVAAGRNGRENTRAERNDRRDHSTADTSGSRETGAASGNRKERIGNAGS